MQADRPRNSQDLSDTPGLHSSETIVFTAASSADTLAALEPLASNWALA